jgi:tetratricopeptide (TPR) repeat protein
LTEAEQFLLAHLYETEGNSLEARKRMRHLVKLHSDDPRFLVPYLSSLIRQGVTDEARVWLARVQELMPNSFEAISLQARLLASQRQEQEVLALVGKYLESKLPDMRTSVERLLRVAGLFDDLDREYGGSYEGYRRNAEKMYRKFAESKNPESIPLLAQFLARQRRFAEAFAQCELGMQTCDPSQLAAVAGLVLQTAPAPSLQLLEQWLTSAIEKKPNTVVFLTLLGQLRERQGRYEDAETVYRRGIARDENDFQLRSNLAYLLACQGMKCAEALDLVQQAIDRGGANAGLLDTRAVVYLALSRADAAIKDLEEAIADSPSAVRYLHLAAAEFAAHNPQSAGKAFQKVYVMGLVLDQLHPFDRANYDKLKTELARR